MNYRSWFSFAFCIVVVLAWNLVGQAQVVPFHASGVNAIYAQPSVGGDGSTSGPGQATHMGKVFGSGVALPILGTNLWVAQNYQLTAANGDQIFLTGGGTVELIPLDPGIGLYTAEWTGEFFVTGGTGRFLNVGLGSGPIAVTADNDPFFLTDPIWTYAWTLDGDIDLGHANN